MRFSILAALVASASAQVIVAPTYGDIPTISTVSYSATPSPSSSAVVSILPIYPLTTASTNGTSPLATGGYYPVPSGYKPNGTSIAPTVAIPTRYTDPTTVMDPAAYGGGAGVGRTISGGLVVIAGAALFL